MWLSEGSVNCSVPLKVAFEFEAIALGALKLLNN